MATWLPLAVVLAVPIVAVAEPPPVQVTRPQAAHRHGRQGPEARFQALVRGLNLDAAQQEKVRQALQAQHEAIRRLSSAPADPGTSRAVAIHAITNRTMERIRAVLNDDQRKLYSQPMPRDYSPGRGKPGVEEWLSGMKRNGT